MASYETTVRTPLPSAEAFEYMADLRNLAAWDPGVRSVEQVAGDGVGAESAYVVVVDGPGRGVALRYEMVQFERPTTFTIEARTRALASRDRVEVAAVEPGGGGAVVRYRAELTLNGALRFADPLLAPFFRRIAGRADRGLQRALGAGS